MSGLLIVGGGVLGKGGRRVAKAGRSGLAG